MPELRRSASKKTTAGNQNLIRYPISISVAPPARRNAAPVDVFAPIKSTLQSHATQVHMLRTYGDPPNVNNGRVRVGASMKVKVDMGDRRQVRQGAARETVTGAKPVRIVDADVTRDNRVPQGAVNVEQRLPRNQPSVSSREASLERPHAKASATKSPQYRFTPPAAAKDSTPVGPTHLSVPDTICPKSLLVQPQALRAFLTITERAGFTGARPKAGVTLLGFFIGRFVKTQVDASYRDRGDHPREQNLVIDRFDPGTHAKDSDAGLEPTFVTDGDTVVPVIRVLQTDASETRQAAVYQYSLNTFQTHMQQVATNGKVSPQSSIMWITAKYDKSFQLEELQYSLFVPDVILRITPIYPLRLIPSAVASVLLRPGMDKPSIGYITIDQARHILALSSSDPEVSSIPLVGIWVADLSIKDPKVQSACFRYILNKTGICKLETGKQTLLIMIVTSHIDKNAQLSFHECSFEVAEAAVRMYTGPLTNGDDDAQFGSRTWKELAQAGNGIRCEELKQMDILEDHALCDSIESVLHVHGLRRKNVEIIRCSTPQPESTHVSNAPARSDDDQAVQSHEEVEAADIAPKDDHPQEASPAVDEPPDVVARCSTDQPPVPTHLQHHQFYLAMLQQQMDILKTHLYGAANPKVAENDAGISALPANHVLAPSTSPPIITRCDAATNTTLIADRSVIHPQPDHHPLHTGEQPPTSSTDHPPPASKKPIPATGAPALTTLGTADLESALKRVNQTDIERMLHFPADTGSNYKPFFSTNVAVEDLVDAEVDRSGPEPEHHGSGTPSHDEEGVGNDDSLMLVNADGDDETKGVTTVANIQPGEGPTAHLLRHVEELLNHDSPQNENHPPGSDRSSMSEVIAEEHQIADVSQIDENRVREQHNGEQQESIVDHQMVDYDHCEDATSDATDMIARLAPHPEKSFIFRAEETDDQDTYPMDPDGNIFARRNSYNNFHRPYHDPSKQDVRKEYVTPIRPKETSLDSRGIWSRDALTSEGTTTTCEPYSFATMAYLRKYQLDG
ncbi:hypothetical protein DFJ77DRAFT_509964 [Powellomyces hirtus]|nr:hypothetical protein DFJ77DRAFT_509964 [Powellomyces hirtus]